MRLQLNPYKILGILYNIPNFIKLLYRLAHDSRVPIFPKLLLMGAIAYLISPYDIVPDFLLPFFGYIEDLIILFIMLKIFIKHSPEDVVWQHVREIERERKKI